VVVLTQRQVEEANRLAVLDLEQWKRRSGGYGRARPDRYLVGKLGEIAAASWFHDNGHNVFPLFAYPKFGPLADLLIDPAGDPTANTDLVPEHADRGNLRQQLIDELQNGLDAHPFGQLLETLPTQAHAREVFDVLQAQRRRREADLQKEARLERQRRLGVEEREGFIADIIPGVSGQVVYRPAPPPEPEPPAVPILERPQPQRFTDLAVEVKTWSDRTWPTYGGSVNAEQLRRILTKSDIVVWCRLEGHHGFGSDTPGEYFQATERHVSIEGWSTLADITAYGQVVWRRGRRAQLQVPTDRLRAPETLTAGSRPDPPYEPRNARRTPPQEGACGHTTFQGLCWGCAWPTDLDPNVRVSDGNAYFFHHADPEAIREAHHGPLLRATTHLEPVWHAALYQPPCAHCFNDDAESLT